MPEPCPARFAPGAGRQRAPHRPVTGDLVRAPDSGVAPGARLVACRTQFYDTRIAAVYDSLIGLREAENLIIVATNSYGIPAGASPPPPGSVEALDDATKAGIHVVFSAGNYHQYAVDPVF